MNKKYLLILGTFLVIISIILLLSHKTAKQGGNQGNAIVLTPTTGQDLPQDVVKNFYSWYISYSNNPITSNEFKNSPYLSTPFKQQMASLNDPTGEYDPVFCKQNQIADVAYELKATNLYMEVIIHQNSIQGIDLYRVVLEHIRGQWLITDTVCIR